MDIPMVIHPLPWDDEEPPPEGRALRKLPPPESAVKAEPEANVQDMEKALIEFDNPPAQRGETS